MIEFADRFQETSHVLRNRVRSGMELDLPDRPRQKVSIQQLLRAGGGSQPAGPGGRKHRAPGDVDTFKFQVGTGDRLAFEIETPETGKPRFNPRMSVFDSDGREFLTNVYKKISRTASSI